MSNDKYNEHLLGKLVNFNETPEEDQEFPTEFFEPPLYSLLIMISILYAFSYTFLSFAMLTSVCQLLNITMYTNLISGISILTGITYAIISNYESDRLIKYFAHKKDFTLKQKILLIIFALLGLGIAFIISNEFLIYWPIFLGGIIQPLSIISSVSHFIIFYSNATELVDKIDDFHIKTLDSIAIFSTLCAFVCTFFITGPLHIAVASFISIGFVSIFLSSMFENDYNISISLDSSIRKYFSLIFHALGEGFIVRGSQPNLWSKIAGFLMSSSEIICDYGSVEGASRYVSVRRLENNNFACLVFDENGKVVDSECRKFNKANSNDDDIILYAKKVYQKEYVHKFEFGLQSVQIKKYINNLKREITLELLYKNNLLQSESFCTKFENVEDLSHDIYKFISNHFVFLNEDHQIIENSPSIELNETPAFEFKIPTFEYPSEAPNHKKDEVLSLFTLITALAFISFVMPSLSIYCLLSISLYWLYKTYLNNNDPIFSPTFSYKDRSSDHGFNYKPILNSIFINKLRIKNKILRYFSTILCLALSIFATFVIPFNISPFILVNICLGFISNFLITKNILTFTLWLLLEDSEQQTFDLARVYDLIFSFKNMFSLIKFISISLISTVIGINGGYEFINSLPLLSQTANYVLVCCFVLFAWMTEGTFINDKISTFFESTKSTDFSKEPKLNQHETVFSSPSMISTSEFN